MTQMTFMWSAAIGQTVFVALWFTKKWHKTWIGRALMTKGIALCLVLWFWIVGYYYPAHPYRAELRDTLLFAMALAIWIQVSAFVIEFYDAEKANRARANRDRVD